MDLIPIKTPKIVRALYPNYLWQMSSSEKAIYLTFDDGPTPEVTDFVLETLNKFQAKATFFCIGSNIESHPDIFQRLVKAEHAIGNHTHQHLKGWNSNLEEYLKDVYQAQATIEYQLKSSSIPKKILFRPPYGKLKRQQARSLIDNNYHVVMWDVLAFDWKATITPKRCAEIVIDNVHSGSIVVFHDSLKARQNMSFALPKVLEHFSNKGYAFKSLNSYINS